MSMNNPSMRLDAGESAFFLRQLEMIDQYAYQRRYPALIARQVIPTFISVADWAHVYTWREWDKLGNAKVVGNMADDLPMVDVTGKEFSQVIKVVGSAYGYDIQEIKSAAAMNLPLDALRAAAARYTCEQLVDQILATGNKDSNLFGILNQDTAAVPVGITQPSTKAAGGVTWGTLLAPNATGQEVANDIIGTAAALVNSTKGIWQKFRVVMPINQYNYAASTRLNAINQVTALQFALSSPFIESITPWFRCSSAGVVAGGGTGDRTAFFPSDPLVLGGIVPMEFTPQAPQLRNLKYIINCIMSCGGVIVRYPVACQYLDNM